MGLEGVKLQFEVPQIPQCNSLRDENTHVPLLTRESNKKLYRMDRKKSLYLVSRAGGQNELAVGVEAQAVDLRGVSLHRVARFGRVVGARVPSEGGRRRVRAGRAIVRLER